jgi:uncharacterized protein (TIGR02217 family)
MSNLLFPGSLSGYTWDCTKSAVFSSIKQQTVTGRDVRVALRGQPIYEFVLINGWLSYADRNTLTAFFAARQGKVDSFLYADEDSVIDNQTFALGDGMTHSFQLTKTQGESVETVKNVADSPLIYIDGVLKTVAIDYNINAVGRVNFVNPPSNGAVLAWTGTAYYRCHFTESSMEYGQFARRLYECNEVKLTGSLGWAGVEEPVPTVPIVSYFDTEFTASRITNTPTEIWGINTATGDATIYRVNKATGARSSFTTEGSQQALDIITVGNEVWVATQTNVQRFDLSGAWLSTITLSKPDLWRLCSDGAFVYVVMRMYGDAVVYNVNLYKINVTTFDVHEIALNSTPAEGIYLYPNELAVYDGRLYLQCNELSTADSFMRVYDVATLTRVYRVAMTDGANTISSFSVANNQINALETVSRSLIKAPLAYDPIKSITTPAFSHADIAFIRSLAKYTVITNSTAGTGTTAGEIRVYHAYQATPLLTAAVYGRVSNAVFSGDGLVWVASAGRLYRVVL